MNKLPLSGIRILEVGNHLSTRYMGFLLAGQGADVVAVSSMQVDRETTLNHPLNAGKRFIEAGDMTSSDFRYHVEGLARRTDVLLSATLSRPEFEWLMPSKMSQSNANLISCDVTATDASDPQNHLPGDEAIIAAAAGLHCGVLEDVSAPLWNSLPIPAYFAGLLGSLSVCMALLSRTGDGEGNAIEVPLFDVALFANGARLINVGMGSDEGGTRDVYGAGFYECSDGMFVRVSTDNPRFMERLVDALGLNYWKNLGLLDRGRLRTDQNTRAELYRRMAELFKSRPANYWDSTLNGVGMPVGVVSPPGSWLANKHALESGSVRPGQVCGLQWSVGQPLSIDDENPLFGPAATVLEGSSVVWPDRSTEATTRMAAKKVVTASPPLQGIKVLDATTVIAGPLSTRILAEYGAEVIKIVDPNNLPEGLKYHFDVNRGKRIGAFDLKDESDSELVSQLARHADVIVHNMSLGTMDRLGFGERDLRRKNESLIYASISAYGSRGPWKPRRGYESQAQAVSGMVHRYSDSGRPRQLPTLVNDYGTGILTAMGVALALLRRKRTGEGATVKTSLTQSATFAQAPLWNQDFCGALHQGDSEAPPLRRVFASSDGWFMLSALRTQLSALVGLLGETSVVQANELPDSRITSLLEGAFRTRTTKDWISRLSEMGVLAHAVVSIEDAIGASSAKSRGLITDVQVVGGARFSASGIAVRTKRNGPSASNWAEPPGASTEEIRERGWRIETRGIASSAEEAKK